MTPQFILRADICREPHCGPYTREARVNEIENMQWASDCINSDAGEKGVLIANWNYFSREAGRLLEQYGYELLWSDTTSTCDECGIAIETQPGFYGDTPSYVIGDCEIICANCLKDNPESYLESLEDDPNRALNVRGVKLAEHGYIKLEDGFESGFHPGQTDNPRKIYDRLKDKYRHIVFAVDSAGQFSIEFSVWHKYDFEVVVGNIGKVYSGNDEVEAGKEFNEYCEQSKDGYGRAAYEAVSLFKNDELINEYAGEMPAE
jgi:hypothetical protein